MKQENSVLGIDAIKINLQDSTELKYWAKKFGVSKDEMRSAVSEAGDSPSAVKRHLEHLQNA